MSTSIRDWSSPRTETSRKRWPRSDSAKTFTIGSTSSKSCWTPCENGARTSCRCAQLRQPVRRRTCATLTPGLPVLTDLRVARQCPGTSQCHAAGVFAVPRRYHSSGASTSQDRVWVRSSRSIHCGHGPLVTGRACHDPGHARRMSQQQDPDRQETRHQPPCADLQAPRHRRTSRGVNAHAAMSSACEKIDHRPVPDRAWHGLLVGPAGTRSVRNRRTNHPTWCRALRQHCLQASSATLPTTTVPQRTTLLSPDYLGTGLSRQA